MDSASSIMAFDDCNGSQLEFKWNEVLGALSTLSLKYVTFGSYVIVLNGKVDATIAGEPYLALQLWFNMKSGKVISRIWDQTIALEKVVDVSQFTQACMAHFQGRPCIGCPVSDDEHRLEGFFISQTPIPRKISTTCHKILNRDTNIKIKSCSECLKLRYSYVQEEAAEQPDASDFEQPAGEEDLLTEENRAKSGSEKRIYLPCDKRRKYEGQYACDTDDCGYRTKKKWNLQVHCKQLSHNSSQLSQHNISAALPQCEMRWHKNEGKFACESADCGYRTDNRSSLHDHCRRKAHHSSCLPQVKSEEINVTCDICEKPFDSRLAYERHRDQEHAGGTLHMKCHICASVLNCDFFAYHMRNQHGQSGTFLRQCDWCEEELSTQSLKWHAMKKHFYGRFLCEKCTFKGDFAKDVISHIIKDHNSLNFAMCPCCSKQHPLEEFEDHYKSCITIKIKKKHFVSNKSDRICETCGKTLRTKNGYREHIKSHLREQGGGEDESSTNLNLYHYCDKCSKRFTHPYYLKTHIKSVHENIQYPCTLCSMIFSTLFKLSRHKLEAHSNDDKYQCKYCGKRFGALTKRKIHEMVHEDPKFKCKYCEKKLKSQKSLEAHERYHTGERPFKCSICGTGFVKKDRLSQHMSGMHKITGPKGGKTGWRKSKEKVKEGT